MDHPTSRPAPQYQPPCAVVVLRPLDQMTCDPTVLARALAGQSLFAAEDMLCRILENLALWLDVLRDGLACDNPVLCVRAARRVTLVASRIGLTGLAQAAAHVAACIAQQDKVALAATLARLERAFDLAVIQVWHIRDG